MDFDTRFIKICWKIGKLWAFECLKMSCNGSDNSVGFAFSSGSFCQFLRVTDEALIAETMVWPNFVLMNVFFALKGSKLFIIICDVTQPNKLCVIKIKDKPLNELH